MDNIIECNNFIDLHDYEKIKEQIDVMQTLTFGENINVLLVTDRLFGCAKGLQEYMQNSTDISVDAINSYANAKQIIEQKPVDFLIIVGCFKNSDNYKIIRLVRKYNKYISVIMYAQLDSIIKSICNGSSIEYKYDRNKPVDGFFEYMHQCYAAEYVKFKNDNPIHTTKEKLRIVVIENEKYNEQLREETYIEEKRKEHRKKILKNIGMAAAVIVMFSIIFLAHYLRDFNKYDEINKKPDRPPNLITASWMVTEDFGAYTSISLQNFVNSEPPIVYLDSDGEYHFANCEIYKDYANPYWLDEIMYKYKFCHVCLTPELINNHIKAYEIMEQDKINNQ